MEDAAIVVGQLPKLFGVPKGSGNFFEQLWHLLGELDETHWLTLLVGLVSLALILGLKRVAPMVPGSLVAVVFGILVVQLLDLDRHGAAIVGRVQPGLPALGLPEVAAVGPLDEGGTPGPGVVAGLAALNLNNVGAQVRQHLAGPGPSQNAGKLQHANTSQRTCHDHSLGSN